MSKSPLAASADDAQKFEVIKPSADARRETVDLVSLPRAFTERVHELSTLPVRLVSSYPLKLKQVHCS
jgi:hypothetical protein